MAGKDQQRIIAKSMYVDQGKQGKEIAALLGVSEVTMSGWVKDGRWKEEREARLNSLSERSENIKKVISNLTEQRLEIDLMRKEATAARDKETIYLCDAQAVGIADQISKWNKALISLDKNNRLTLDLYLEVMDEVFKSMMAYDNPLYMKTLDFQQAHVEFISKKLG